MKRLLALLAIAIAVTTVGCDSLTGGGTKKVVVNEQVCGTVNLLNLKLGEETRIILDNSEHSENQLGLGLVLNQFPIVITSGHRPDAEVGPTFTTVPLYAQPGEEDEVTVEPTFTGEYVADCRLTLQQETGEQNIQQGLRFQIVD